MMIPQWLTRFVEGKIRAAAARVRVITKSGRPVELAGYAGAAGEESYQDPALLMQQYGFRSRPGPGSEAATLKVMGEKTQALFVATEAPGVGPNDQADWEVEVYAKTGQRIRLMADGSLRLSATGGAVAQLLTNGSVVLTDGSGGTATLAAGRLTLSQDVARDHDLGTGNAPACAAAAPLLSLANASTTAITGTDRLCRVTLTVAGANPAPAGTALFVVTFARAYSSGAMGQVTQESGGKKYTYSVSNSAVTVTADETIAVGTTLVFVVSSGGLA